MRALSITIALALGATGCKQIFGLDRPTELDAGGGPIPTIGFAMPTTLTDEASGLVAIPVLLTEPADREVSLSFRVLGGTATDGEDYTIEQELVVIPPGSQAGALEVAIAADQVLEENETIELALEMPRGATLGLAQHTLTINATVLPRVNFVVAASSVAETTTRQSMTVTLDMASPIETNVMIGGTGTATDVADYAIVAPTITFAPGMTTQIVQVDVKHDTLDEDDETAILTLLSADAAIVGTMPTHTLTISDNDNPPTVSLASSSDSVAENGATATITVQLNTPSGKNIMVPFTAGGTAVATTDYTYATASPLTIPAGSMSGMITVNVVDDLLQEGNRTLTTTLGTPNNAQLGSPSVHTLTITENEVTCVGPTGTAFQVCYVAAPTAIATLPSSLDTDSGALCQATQPVGWTAAGQPNACVIWATSINGNNTIVTGSRPLVLASAGAITITSSLDASSLRDPSRSGAGAPSAACAPFPTAPNASGGGAGGGAGGSFMTKGGNGGPGIGVGGTSPAADAAAPTVLRAGCSGQRGAAGGGGPGGTPGLGGGAMYLVAGTSITVQGGAYVNASGAAGANVSSISAPDAGGSGAGSGGMIRLYAPSLVVTGAAFLVNGGGGSEGNSSSGNGQDGEDVDPDQPLQPAAGGSGLLAAGNGGQGFAGTNGASNGGSGNNGGGGGGGGGGGLIHTNIALTGATVSTGSIVVQ